MNVLKKSTLALAIAGFASAASAATITPALNNTYSNDIQHWVLSNQGIEVGQYHRDEVQFDLKVVNAHESRSEFDIVLPETLDLQELGLGANGALTLLEVAGDSKYYINGTNLDDSTLAIRVGTGSFSVEAYKLNSLTNTLTLISGVGQSLLPGSSVGITLGSNAPATDKLVRITGAADITVNTYTDAREFIETAEATFATTSDQFELSLREGTSELVDRVDQSYFASEVFYNDDRVTTSGTESNETVYELYQDTNEGVVRLTNDLALVAKADVDSVDVSLFGDFSQAFSAAHDDFVFAADQDGAVLAQTATVAGFRVLNDGTEIPVDADTVKQTDLRLAFDNATANVADLQNSFDIAAKLQYSGSITGDKASNVELAKTEFGEWILDQAIINVPYMPVGYKAKGIDAVFEIANRGWADAAIKVKGFDQYGNVFPATALVDAGKIENNGVAAAQTIVKVSADDILATFGLKEGDQRKMNITFMIDANRADIDLVPYYNNNGGRTPIMNSQYKDGAERR